MTYAENVVQWLRDRLQRDPPLSQGGELNLALRVLALWRVAMIKDVYIRQHGRRVLQGPFAGMAYVETATEGALLPRLLGSYESELHPFLSDILEAGVDRIIDVGCAEGYYAVGLALLAPHCTVQAFDTDAQARAACAQMAAMNGVSERVLIGGALQAADLQDLAGPRTLVLMDVEGAEEELLQPDLAPSLSQATLIVEAHEVYRPGIAERLTRRFEPTHHVRLVHGGPKAVVLPDWLRQANHLDQLLAVWEWRLGPTPWLVMRPRREGRQPDPPGEQPRPPTDPATVP